MESFDQWALANAALTCCANYDKSIATAKPVEIVRLLAPPSQLLAIYTMWAVTADGASRKVSRPSTLPTLSIVTRLEHVEHGHRNDNLQAVAGQPPRPPEQVERSEH